MTGSYRLHPHTITRKICLSHNVPESPILWIGHSKIVDRDGRIVAPDVTVGQGEKCSLLPAYTGDLSNAFNAEVYEKMAILEIVEWSASARRILTATR